MLNKSELRPSSRVLVGLDVNALATGDRNLYTLRAYTGQSVIHVEDNVGRNVVRRPNQTGIRTNANMMGWIIRGMVWIDALTNRVTFPGTTRSVVEKHRTNHTVVVNQCMFNVSEHIH